MRPGEYLPRRNSKLGDSISEKLTNAYIYASKEERGKMDKKPYYRQSAIVFCILCAVFLVIGLSLLLHKDKLFLLEIPLIVGVIIYAIVSTVQINKQTKR